MGPCLSPSLWFCFLCCFQARILFWPLIIRGEKSEVIYKIYPMPSILPSEHRLDLERPFQNILGPSLLHRTLGLTCILSTARGICFSERRRNCTQPTQQRLSISFPELAGTHFSALWPETGRGECLCVPWRCDHIVCNSAGASHRIQSWRQVSWKEPEGVCCTSH